MSFLETGTCAISGCLSLSHNYHRIDNIGPSSLNTCVILMSIHIILLDKMCRDMDGLLNPHLSHGGANHESSHHVTCHYQHLHVICVVLQFHILRPSDANQQQQLAGGWSITLRNVLPMPSMSFNWNLIVLLVQQFCSE